jgi:opacity protein-like surface antigen
MAKLAPHALAAIGAISCAEASAADLPPAPSLPPAAAETPFSGWYLRGDIGVGVNSAEPELRAAPDPFAPGLAGPATWRSASLSPSGMADIGAGYQLNGWLRADATFEYRALADLRARYGFAASPGFASPALYAGAADLSSFVGLVNGYLTPGSWFGFSPFVGGGVGVADNRISSFSAEGVSYAGGSKTGFAWALMAGVDYDITPNLRLELGYRYLNTGAIASGGANCWAAAGAGLFAASCRGPETISSRGRLASSDIRLGLIYLIGDASLPAAPNLD